MDFGEFDPAIGVDGYCDAIRRVLYPNSTSESVEAAALKLEYRIYVKGSIFSRVRPIGAPDLDRFLNSRITRNEFFPATPRVAEATIGRFNAQGERKLYLADHPYVALKECGIEPGQHFLFSYFSFNTDAFFMDAEPAGTPFSEILSALFKSHDKRFYEVINRVYASYMDYPEFQGVAYSSVRVPKMHHDVAWGEIDSTTNLAMKEDYMPAANLVAGWLAQCDEYYRPRYLRMYAPLNPKKKNKLAALTYRGNKSEFISSTNAMMHEIQNIKRKSELRIKNKEYNDPKLSPIKFLFKE